MLGYPALRVQHHYLAFVTLAFTTLVFLVLRNEEWLTGGIYGLSGISAADPVRLVDQQLGAILLLQPRRLDRAGGWHLVDAALALGPRLRRACAKIRSARCRSASTRGATR